MGELISLVPFFVPHATSCHTLPTYDEVILSDQGITARARMVPDVHNVLHQIDYSSDPEEAGIHFELTPPSRYVRSREQCMSPQRPRRRSSPDHLGVSHHHHYHGNINVRQPLWTTDNTTSYRTHTRPEEMMEALQEMKETLHQEEILVDDHHLTAKVLKYQEEGELVDRLMEILEMMDHQIMEDIPQDKDHQEADPQDHQEEDHLVPLAHLEILDPQEIEDLQVPLDHEDTEDPWTTRTYGTTGVTWTNYWTILSAWKCSSITSKNGYIRFRENFSWHG